MKYRIVTYTLLLLLIAGISLLSAQTPWKVISGGGNSSESPSYRLSSTVGQSVTGLVSAGDKVAQQGFWPAASEPWSYVCGDVDNDSLVNISDVVFIIDRIFRAGPPPSVEKAGDVNCDGQLDVTDAVYILQYIFAGGGVPCEACQ